MSRLLIALVALFLLVPVVSARDIWVDNSCPEPGDGSSQVCGPSGPYTDLQSALSVALPGDTVLIKNGTGVYVTTHLGVPWESDDRSRPQNDGGFHVSTPSGPLNPLTITSAPGHFPLLANCQANDFTTYCHNPTFTAVGGRIVFDRVHVQGGIVIRGSVAVINSRISKGWEPYGDGNLGAIKIINPEGVHSWNVGPFRNNYFHDLVWLNSGHTNIPYTRAWIYTWYTDDLLIEYNTFEGFEMTGGQGALTDKHSQSQNLTFRYNFIIDGKGGAKGSHGEIHSYGNVIHCGQHTQGDGLELSMGDQYHNTIVNCRSGYYVHNDQSSSTPSGVRDGQLYNNIFNSLYEGAQRRFEPPGELFPADYFTGFERIDYNVYTPNRRFYWMFAHYGQLWDEWRTGIAADFGFDQNSAELECEFRDSANHDYRLVPGSACTTFGRVGGIPSGAVVELGAFAVTNCVGHLCSPGSGYISYDSSWRTSFAAPTLPSDPPPRVGDLTGDGVVGIDDLLVVVANIGRVSSHPEFDSRADVNGDGVVDIFDLVLVAREFGS